MGQSKTPEHVREARLQAILDGAMDALVAMDANGYVIEWSIQAEQLFGWRREEAVGQLLSQLIIPPRFRAAHEAGLSQYHKTGQQHFLNSRIEIFACRKDGTEIPVELGIRSARQGDDLIFIGSLRDNSLRKRTLDLLADSEKEYRAVFEQVTVGIAQIGLTYQWLRINRQLMETLGYAPDTLAKLTIKDIIHPEDLQTTQHNISCLLESRHNAFNLETRLIRPDGAVIWTAMTGNLMRDAMGEPKCFLIAIEDITNRKNAEMQFRAHQDELQSTLHLFRTFMHHSQDIICAADLSGIVTQISDASEWMLGYRPDEMVGQPLLDFIHPDDRAVSISTGRTMIATNEPQELRNRFIRKDGTIAAIHWSSYWSNTTQQLFAFGRSISAT